jgi:hypothetical protein
LLVWVPPPGYPIRATESLGPRAGAFILERRSANERAMRAVEYLFGPHIEIANAFAHRQGWRPYGRGQWLKRDGVVVNFLTLLPQLEIVADWASAGSTANSEATAGGRGLSRWLRQGARARVVSVRVAFGPRPSLKARPHARPLSPHPKEARNGDDVDDQSHKHGDRPNLGDHCPHSPY